MKKIIDIPVGVPPILDGSYTLFMRISVLLFLCFQIISCMPVIKLVYGLHKPRYVSDTKVVRYSEQLGWQGDIYRLKDYSEENRSKYRYLGNSFPDVLIFNSTGQLTKFDIDCSNDLQSIVELSLFDIETLGLEGKSLQDFIDDTYVINTSNNECISLLKMPFYVIKFAEYAGRLNKENVPAMVERLSSRIDIHYIILNMDYSVQK